MKKTTAAKTPFSRFVHVGIVVRDMDKAVKRLSSLGMGPFEAISVPPFTETPLFRGKALNARVKGLVFKTGGVAIELIQPLEGDSPWKEFLDSKGEGIHHIGFGVDDMDKEVDNLTRQGCSVLKLSRRHNGGSAYLTELLGDIVVELEMTQLW
jgi:methylmalonyl-CoA/ethylmalonyl-CoA epimerase